MVPRPNHAGATRYDAVVVGAGPAGGVTAAILASRGMRTLLVDRARFPRQKLCGGCLAPAGMQVLDRLGITQHLPRLDSLRLESLRIIARGVSHDLPIMPYFAVERASLDQAVCEAAIARGAEFRDGVAAKVLPDDTVRLEHDGQSETLKPSVIVVADGVGGSALSERAEFAPRVRKQSVIGVGSLLPSRPAHAQHNAITMVCARGGYVGTAPSGDGRWSLAAALDPAAVRCDGPIDTLRRIFAASDLQPPEFAKGQLRGVGNLTRHRTPAAGRVLVVGDAAAYFQPLTGEGMSWAMACAEQIWPHAQAAARGEDPAKQWQAACARILRTRHAMCRAVCTLAAHPARCGWVLGAGRTTPAMGWLSRRLCWSPA
ncbi:MAG: hypothetical protein HND58_17205 [Planctomycetota bacterium]|nr:MAG: hypothetical protein HND58_17205 [Planctomycetota bacterium]